MIVHLVVVGQLPNGGLMGQAHRHKLALPNGGNKRSNVGYLRIKSSKGEIWTKPKKP